jgi:hypothetical protein
MLGRWKYIELSHWYLSLILAALLMLARHKSPSIDRIPAEVIQAGGETLCSQVHKLINSITHSWS